MTLRSGLYVGSVFHRRLAPKPHRFRYRLFWLLIDLDELDELDRSLTIFSHNRPNLFSLYERDHGDGGETPLRAQAEGLLEAHGIDTDGGSIRLLCMPRALGYGFNPISVYFCERPDGALAALIYQVHNTFGERHSYVLPVANGGGAVRQACDKRFFVSPFLPMGLRYEFHVAPPGETLTVAIRVSGPDGVMLRAALTGKRRELTDGALLKAGLAVPVEAMKTTAAIHWQALRLMAKGVAYRGRDGAQTPVRAEAEMAVTHESELKPTRRGGVDSARLAPVPDLCAIPSFTDDQIPGENDHEENADRDHQLHERFVVPDPEPQLRQPGRRTGEEEAEAGRNRPVHGFVSSATTAVP
jgi:uncharacterized protein